MYTRRRWENRRVAALLGSCLLLAACSGESPGDDGRGGQGGEPSEGDGEGGAGGGLAPGLPDEIIGPRGRAFEPEGIALQDVTRFPSGLEIVSFTLIQEDDVFGVPEWLIAVRNTSSTTLCSVNLSASFFDEDDKLLAGAAYESIDASTWSGIDGYRECLGPDDVGMASIDFGSDEFIVANVGRIEYQFSSIENSTMKRISSVKIEEIGLTPLFGKRAMKGVLKNGLPTAIRSPSVQVFAVDALGRPYGYFLAIDLIDVAPGASWEFLSTTFGGDVDKFVVYHRFRQPVSP